MFSIIIKKNSRQIKQIVCFLMIFQLIFQLSHWYCGHIGISYVILKM